MRSWTDVGRHPIWGVGRGPFLAASLLALAAWTGSAAAADATAQATTQATADAPAAVTDSQDASLPSDAQIDDRQLRVGNIEVEGLNVFDTRREDEDNVVFRLANWLHIQTRRDAILSQLLLQPGDLLKVRLLRESERLLRANGYLHDARIEVVAVHEGLADLRVTTQDVWTLKPGVSFGRKGGHNSTAIGIEEGNLFGWGKSLGVDVKSSVDRSTKVFRYGDPHLFSTHWALDAEYDDNSDGRTHKLSLQRPFRALDDRWSAGFSYAHDRRVDSIYQMGRIVDAYRTVEANASAFVGWSQGLRDDATLRWTAGLARETQQHGPSEGTVGPVPPGMKLAYPWVGANWVQDQFEATRNHDQIGKTEDLAMGWNIGGKLGLARPSWGSDRNATVFEASLSRGWEPSLGHLLTVSGNAKGRFEDEGFAGTLVNLNGRYYWRHAPSRSFFASVTVDRGIRMDADQQIQLGGDSGLRGYPLRYQRGAGRWLVTLEERAYSDWYPFRLLRVGGAVFFDMGRTWDGHDPLDTSQGLLRDVGVGLRLGNSRSAVGTVVHVDAAFPLDGDRSLKKVQFVVEAKKSF